MHPANQLNNWISSVMKIYLDVSGACFGDYCESPVFAGSEQMVSLSLSCCQAERRMGQKLSEADQG